MDLAKAILLGNLTLSATDDQRIAFDGTLIRCQLFDGALSVLSLQDVAGLIDLRFAADEVLGSLISVFSPQDGDLKTVSKVKQLAASGRFISAGDVLIAAGLDRKTADWLAGFTTIHGRGSRLARAVTPPGLQDVLSRSGLNEANLYGAGPSNALYRVEVFLKTARGRETYGISLFSLDPSKTPIFRKIFEKRLPHAAGQGSKAFDGMTGASSRGVSCRYLGR
ncbi:hypothetical protein FJ695_00150 [Labrenzia sp. PHM005]|nr:hypothetical protein FJ695_00150 [Labrenzia sp. PHM005]